VRLRPLLTLFGLVVTAVAATAFIVVRSDSDGDGRAPARMNGLKSGVGRVEILNCNGTPFSISGHRVSGSGFLVGVTAEHGMWVGLDQPACKMRVRFGAKTYAVTDANGGSQPVSELVPP
jgi:hypothetical protein